MRCAYKYLLKFYKWVEENELIDNSSEEMQKRINKAQRSIVEDLSKIKQK